MIRQFGQRRKKLKRAAFAHNLAGSGRHSHSESPTRIVADICLRTWFVWLPVCFSSQKALRFCHKRLESVVGKRTMDTAWARFFGGYQAAIPAPMAVWRVSKNAFQSDS
jgi:hypothetical protein